MLVDVIVAACRWRVDIVLMLAQMLPAARVFVYSKCGTCLPGVGNGTCTVLDNVGRCDHTYAYHMVHARQPYADVAVFMKDSWRAHSMFATVELDQLVDRAARRGFVCGSIAPVWHHPSRLSKFKLGKYNKKYDWPRLSVTGHFSSEYTSLGAWVADMAPGEIDLNSSTKAVPVCYGGIFAATRVQLERQSPATLQRILASLQRGDNIEESHFAERTWAALLSPPPRTNRERWLVDHCVQRAQFHRRDARAGMWGMARNC